MHDFNLKYFQTSNKLNHNDVITLLNKYQSVAVNQISENTWHELMKFVQTHIQIESHSSLIIEIVRLFEQGSNESISDAQYCLGICGFE